ncbi:MAG: hypothetical protein KF752_15825 [Pirellulaceae bacterium]|nr:hypothetical protein [Pirellulaceae bacterium]
MVRLRSDRWYSSDGQQRRGRAAHQATSGTRRLISLVFLLGLVLLLMRQASDPHNVQRAFQALGVPLDQAQNKLEPTSTDIAHQAQGSSDQNDESSLWGATCRDLAPRLLSGADVPQVLALAEFWFAAQPFTGGTSQAQSLSELGQMVEIELDRLRQQLPESASATHQWDEQLERYRQQWQLLQSAFSGYAAAEFTGRSSPLDPYFRTTIGDYLDRRLVESLRDGAPWTPLESRAFWRLLQRGRDYQAGSTPLERVATRQLAGDHARYRGRWVVLRGSVRRVEVVDRSDAATRIDRYRVLWLRGEDGSNQPVPVYAVQKEVEKLADDVLAGGTPDIEVVGLVGKRLAYSAPAGVQVVTTLFAGHIKLLYSNAGVGGVTGQPTQSDKVGLGPSGLIRLGTGLLILSSLAWLWMRLAPWLRRRWRSSPNRLAQLALLIFAPSISSWRCAAQEQLPPWAATSDSKATAQAIIQQRLQGVVTPELIQRWASPRQGESLTVADELLRTLFAINQIGWRRLRQVENAIPVGVDCQLASFDLVGWVRDCHAMQLSDSQHAWFSGSAKQQLYRMSVSSGSHDADAARDPSQEAIVFSLHIPTVWQNQLQLFQPVRIQGLALRAQSHPSARPVILVDGPNWTFDAIHASSRVNLAAQVNLELSSHSPDAWMSQLVPKLKPSWTALASAEFDLSWLDVMAENNRKRLSSAESEPFVKLLRTVKQSGVASDEQRVSPLSALQHPLDHLGAAIDWPVRLVSGTLVQIDQPVGNPPLRYYQFDGFLKMPGQRIEFGDVDLTDSISFDGEFPVTLVMLGESEFVPQQLESGGSGSWTVGKHARAVGRFYRLWSYHSQRLSTASQEVRQIAPLVVVASLQSYQPQVSSHQFVGWFSAALCAAVVVTMLGILAIAQRNMQRK